MEKYLLTVTARYDGSSKFSKNHKFAFFPSAALAWRVSEEGFMKDVDWISNLKLRGSIGQTGNQSISPYQMLSGQNLITITSYSHYDPEASWTSSAVNGWDRGVYPSAKSFTLGLQVKF